MLLLFFPKTDELGSKTWGIGRDEYDRFIIDEARLRNSIQKCSQIEQMRQT